MRASKLLGLEVLRFVAAFAVLVWHYQHFAFDGKAIAVLRDQQPGYAVLWPFYEFGWYGVQVFWSISGFIFFWRYGSSVAAGSVSAWRFFVLRWSRLYPLHVLTLVLVAALQLAYVSRTGHAFVYQYNDAWHFFLNLFLASHWGWQAGYSFNGPIWSISVEVVVYLVFFISLRWVRQRVLVNVLGLLLAVAMRLMGQSHPILDCLGWFFAGGLGAQLYQGRYGAARTLRMVAWAVTLVGPLVLGRLPLGASALWLAMLGYAPLALYALAAPLPVGARLTRLIEGAGNLTYASYLLHFPLQLAIALACDALGTAIPVYRGALWCGFMGATLAGAYASYRWIELPAQQWLRRRGTKAPLPA